MLVRTSLVQGQTTRRPEPRRQSLMNKRFPEIRIDQNVAHQVTFIGPSYLPEMPVRFTRPDLVLTVRKWNVLRANSIPLGGQ